jgi:hypothetical protein
MRRATLLILTVAATVISSLPALAFPGQHRYSRIRAAVVNTRANEFSPAADGDYVSWTATAVRRHGRTRVYYSLDGGPRQRANPPGTRKAWNGGIDGTHLVYSLSGGGDANLVLFDMASQTELPLPDGVNTAAREHSSSISGDYLLFDRDDFSGGSRGEDIVLYNTMADEELILVHTEDNDEFFQSGQVNGNWAVYFHCQSSGVCDVLRYDIAEEETVTVPNVGGRQQYSPSVAEDGTVYFVRSRPACGERVRYMVWDGVADPSVFTDFRNRRDSFDSFYDDATDSLYYERLSCRDFQSGIFMKPAAASG